VVEERDSSTASTSRRSSIRTGDGVGDLNGLTRQIDYLAGLGVTCIWLMPFQPTPNRDDGYDITDHYGVDRRFGSIGDFVELVRTAGDRGIRVVIDLVVNHTSNEHPWFQSARSSPDDPKHDWYVWRDEPSDEPKGLFFPDRETSNWAHDRKAGRYYLHRFYSFQPDLNTANHAVRDEIARIAGYWLQLGVAGFRIDVPALLETDDPAVFAHRCDSDDGTVIAVHNLGDGAVEAAFELGDDVTGVDDLLEARDHKVRKGGRLEVKLARYGYLWLRVRRDGERRLT
jgi:glycosidase